MALTPEEEEKVRDLIAQAQVTISDLELVDEALDDDVFAFDGSLGTLAISWASIKETFIATVNEALNGKANIDGSGFNDEGKQILAVSSLPSDTYETLSVLNGGSVDAPADGWFIVETSTTEWGGQQAYIIQHTGGFNNATYGDDGMTTTRVLIPAKKGQTLYAWGSSALSFVRFVRCEGVS